MFIVYSTSHSKNMQKCLAIQYYISQTLTNIKRRPLGQAPNIFLTTYPTVPQCQGTNPYPTEREKGKSSTQTCRLGDVLLPRRRLDPSLSVPANHKFDPQGKQLPLALHLGEGPREKQWGIFKSLHPYCVKIRTNIISIINIVYICMW